MATIEYWSEKFPETHLKNSYGNLVTTWNEVIHAALTVGRPETIWMNGGQSRSQSQYRIGMLRMAIRPGKKNGPFRMTDEYKELDPTEKGSISYSLGLTFTKLFMSKLLDTHWPLHIDVFKDQLNPRFRRGKSRPDLAAYCTSKDEWYAFECKGRTSHPDSTAKKKAKDQARRIISVQGKKCALRVGAIASFRNDKLEFFWRDPPSEGEGEELKVPRDAWRFYYSPFYELYEAADAIDGNGFRYYKELDIRLRIQDKLLSMLRSGLWDEAQAYASGLELQMRSLGLEADGLKIEVGDSWR